MEAYVHGVSTRSVDDLVAAMGVESGVSKSEVSRICAGLDKEIEAFRTRSLTHTAVSVRVLRCHVLQGPRRGARGLSGPGGGHRGVHRRHPRSAGHRGRRQRVLRVLARVPRLAEGPRADRGASGHLRCPRWIESCCGPTVHRIVVAAVPGAFHAQPAHRGGGQARPGGDRGGQDDLRPHRPRRGRRPVGPRRRHPGRQLSEGGRR